MINLFTNGDQEKQRMPKRRKSLYSNKAPLIFTESPVNKQNNVPSPIYCARHPRTAKSVPVEDLHDLTWVSPQFQSIHASTKKIKKQRKRRSTSGPKCTCHHGNLNSPVVTRGNTKFKALKFVGEKTPPVTIIEDVSFEEDDDNISQDSKSPCLNRTELAIKRKARSRLRKRPALSESLCNNRTQNENSVDHNHSGFNLEHVNNSIHTPKTEMVPRHKPQRNTPQNGSRDNEVSLTLFNGQNSPVQRLFTAMTEAPESDVFTRIKNRKSANRQHNGLLKNMYSSMCSSPVQKSRVLVADTPESDYGIPYHLRRLRRQQKPDNT